MFNQIIVLFLAWKGIILYFASLAPFLFSQKYGFLANDFYPDAPYLNWIWANSDGGFYLNIARHGYTDLFSPAFFPFYPFIIFLVHKIFSISSLDAGLDVSNVALFVSLVVVYKIILLDYNKNRALRTLIFLLAFPVSFFYGSVYTESIYLLNAALSFYFARKSNWLLAGLFGILAGLSRLVGIALLPALLVEWYVQHQKNISFSSFLKSRAFYIFLIPLGIVIYSVYLQFKFGDFLIFQKAMSAWNQSQFIFPPQVIWRYLKIFLTFPQNDLAYWIAVLEFTSTIFYFSLAFYVYKKIRISYGTFMFVSLIIPVFTGTLQSMPRYILPLFPAFLALAMLTEKNRLLFWGVIITFLVLGFILLSLFTRGYFVA